MKTDEELREMSIEELQAYKTEIEAGRRELREEKRRIAAIEDEKVRDRRIETYSRTLPEFARSTYVQAARAAANGGANPAGG